MRPPGLQYPGGVESSVYPSGGAFATNAAPIVPEVLPLMVTSDRPYRVVEGAEQVGILDRAAVLTAMMESAG